MPPSDPSAARRLIIDLLGVEFDQQTVPSAHIVASHKIAGGERHDIILNTPDGEIEGTFLKPLATEQPSGAILYCHAHGNRYDIGSDELCDGRPALIAPYAEDLLAQGLSVLCLDMACFRSRSHLIESAASIAALWRGSTLFGAMLRDLTFGLNYLCDHPHIDAERIGIMGISMGGTHAWWLGALDVRLKAIVHMCCFADLKSLIETDAHDGHGAYMTVPGLVPQISSGQLAGLAAPRAQLACIGLLDWSTPKACFDIGQADLKEAYQNAPDQLKFHIEPDHGHEETMAMRQAVLHFLKDQLAPL